MCVFSVCVIACDISAMAALSFPHSPVKLKQIFAPILLNSFDLCDVRACVAFEAFRLRVHKPAACI